MRISAGCLTCVVVEVLGCLAMVPDLAQPDDLRDAINAILVAAGHNLRLLIAWFAALLRAILAVWLPQQPAIAR